MWSACCMFWPCCVIECGHFRCLQPCSYRCCEVGKCRIIAFIPTVMTMKVILGILLMAQTSGSLHLCSFVNIRGSREGGDGFDSWSRHQLYWLKICVVLLKSLLVNCNTVS
jgi:hypothetical protein